MELVIKISEQEYNECKNQFNKIYQDGYLNYNLNTTLIMYIANGIPLPKDHGRLIDADVLINKCAYDLDNNFVIDLIDVKETQTIIEADKG